MTYFPFRDMIKTDKMTAFNDNKCKKFSLKFSLNTIYFEFLNFTTMYQKVTYSEGLEGLSCVEFISVYSLLIIQIPPSPPKEKPGKTAKNGADAGFLLILILAELR